MKSIPTPTATHTLTKANWSDWGSVNLYEFRTLFPEFRQFEITANNQIISGVYKQSIVPNNLHSSAIDVFNIFLHNPEIRERADKWAEDIQRKVKLKNIAPITPTIIGPRAKG